MAATRTPAEFNSSGRGKKLLASNAKERGLSPFPLIPQMVPSIIKIPQSKKAGSENSTINKCRGMQFEHNFKLGQAELQCQTF